MKLSEALTKLKNLKSQLSRVEGYVNSSVIHFVDEQPEYSYAEESKVRSQLVNAILDLKTQIQVTNTNTKADFQGSSVTLAHLILLNSQLRSEMAFLSKLLGNKVEYEGGYLSGGRTKETIKKVFAEGFDKKHIRKSIETLEKAKEELESLLAHLNLKTDLIEK